MRNCMRTSSVFLILLSLSCGCSNADGSGQPALYEVTGEVLVNGDPVDEGAITLDPADGKGGVYSAQIQSGKFSLKASAGSKRVSITASRPSEDLGPDGKPMPRQYLPPRYNAKTKLTAEVSATGENFLEFKLDGDM